MSCRIRLHVALVVLALCALVLPTARAQSDTAKRPIGPADYGKWESLGYSTAIAADGRWLAYGVNRVNEENELRIASLVRDTTFVVPNGSNASFTKDGRWVAYAIGVGPAEQRRLEKEKKPIRAALGLRNLMSGDTLVIADVAGFAFSDGGAYVAMRRYPPENGGDRTHDGVTLVVRDLATGVETSFGNVSSFAWQEAGTLLALLLDAEGQAGNGVQLYDPVSGRLRTLDSKTTRYSTLTWREEDDDLAVLRVRGDDERYEDSTHVVLAWRDLAGRRPTSFAFDPDSAAGFPADMRIVPFAGLRWADDGSILYFGIQQRKLAPDTAKAEADSTAADSANDDEEPSTVQIWHARDVRPYPLQKFRAQHDREECLLSAWHLDAGRFVQLGTALVRDVRIVEGDRYAFGTDPSRYEKEGMFGPSLQDLYLIDVATGSPTLVKERVQYSYGPSSGGQYLLYLVEDHYWTFDIRTGRHTNITEGLPTSFVDLETRYAGQQPPFGVVGWTRNDRSVLVNAEYDVWELRPDGTRPTRLTDGAADRIRHRRAWLDPEEEYLDTSQPLYFALYGEWTKWYGYSRLANGRLERLVWQDANVGRLSKAEEAEVYLYVTQRVDDSPDYYVAGPDLRNARQVSHTNPFQSDYLWGHAELIEYQNTWGEDLQGALFYPAGYEPGKQYPMIVYIYTIMSPYVHTYRVPSNRSAYNTTVWTSQGYFVLQPDIVYRDRNPGLSAVEAIVPAVETVLETGMVDPKRVGLTGHSWGGYQTAFVVTQTDVFAAAVAGAPLTDLVSMYLSVMWNFGDPNAQVLERGLFGQSWAPFWEDLEGYIANSPVFQAQNLNTPLLVAHGDEDGNVDFNQGVEYYNAARRTGKDFVLLVYEGENHGNRRKANQIDYHTRIVEWFGHYLKGDPAPTWIVAGVSYLDQAEANKRKGRIN